MIPAEVRSRRPRSGGGDPAGLQGDRAPSGAYGDGVPVAQVGRGGHTSRGDVARRHLSRPAGVGGVGPARARCGVREHGDAPRRTLGRSQTGVRRPRRPCSSLPAPAGPRGRGCCRRCSKPVVVLIVCPVGALETGDPGSRHTGIERPVDAAPTLTRPRPPRPRSRSSQRGRLSRAGRRNRLGEVQARTAPAGRRNPRDGGTRGTAEPADPVSGNAPGRRLRGRGVNENDGARLGHGPRPAGQQSPVASAARSAATIAAGEATPAASSPPSTAWQTTWRTWRPSTCGRSERRDRGPHRQSRWCDG